MADGFLGLSNSDLFSMFSGLGILQSAFAGIGQYESGQAQKAAYDYNAKVALQEAQNKAIDVSGKYQALIGKQTSLYAKAGVDVASGSPLLVAVTTAATGAQEVAAIQEEGQEQATLDEYYAKVAAWSGTMGGISTFLEGLSGAGKGMMMAKMYSQMFPSMTGVAV